MAVNLKKLLSNDKFIPIYNNRIDEIRETLGPVAVELHWTSNCNYNCIHCSYGTRRQERAELSTEVIQSVVDDLIDLKTRAVYLSGGGEPTVVNGWDKYAKQFMDNNVEVALITNGIAIKKKKLNIIRRLNYIALSIYSTNQREYKKITGSNFFETQFKLPKMIKNKDNNAIVGSRCVLNNINYKRVTEIYERAIESKFDYVIFIPAVDYEGRGIALSLDEMNKVKEIINKNYDSFDFTKTNLDGLLTKDIHHYNDNDYRDDFSYEINKCNVIDIRGNAFINYDGGVYLCQPHIGAEEYCIGNVNASNFKDIWNSNRHLGVIKKLNQEFANGLCQNCRAINFNKIADEYKYNLEITSKGIEDPFI